MSWREFKEKEYTSKESLSGKIQFLIQVLDESIVAFAGSSFVSQPHVTSFRLDS